jgi:hypothetical protein
MRQMCANATRFPKAVSDSAQSEPRTAFKVRVNRSDFDLTDWTKHGALVAARCFDGRKYGERS